MLEKSTYRQDEPYVCAYQEILAIRCICFNLLCGGNIIDIVPRRGEYVALRTVHRNDVVR